MSEVLRYVLDTITPASAAHAEGARLRLAKAGTPMLERLGMTIAGAQHTPRPHADKRTIVVVAGDHGAGDPGISLGASHPTIIAALAIADGSSALSQIARASRAPVVLVAAGVQEHKHLPATAIELAGRPSANIVGARDSDELVQIGRSPSSSRVGTAATKPDARSATTPGTESTKNLAAGSTTNPGAGSAATPGTESTKSLAAGSTKNLAAGSTTKPDAGSATNLSAGSTTNLDAGSTTKPDAGSATNLSAGSTTNLDARSTTKPDAGSATNLSAGSTTNLSAGSTTNLDSGSTTKPGAGSETKPGAGSTTKPGAGSTTGGVGSTTKPGAGSETKPGAGSETKPGAGSTTKPGAGSMTKPGAGSTAGGVGSATKSGASVSAMTVADATLGLEAGIALAISLSEPGPDRPRDLPSQPGLDVLAIGAIGVGSDVASAALLGAALGAAPTGLGDPVAEAAGAMGAEFAASYGPRRARGRGADEIVGARGRANESAGGASAGRASAGRGESAGANDATYGLELLAAFGGPDTAVLAGLILAAASMNVPIILDGYATGAAALVAIALAPDVRGYLVAAHNGTFTMPRILAHLGLQPVFEVGLGHGEGTGAAMVLPMLDQVAAIATT